MGEGRQTPVDIRQEQADVIEGQIDALGKAFLGQTIACARRHDHKSDPISTRDYYALAGCLKSSRYPQAFIDPPDRITDKVRQLVALKKRIDELLVPELASQWREQAASISRYLLAAREVAAVTPAGGVSAAEAAQHFDVDEQRLEQWLKALQHRSVTVSDHPLYAWMQLGHKPGLTAQEFAEQRSALLSVLREQQNEAARTIASAQSYASFKELNFDRWQVTGDAFGAGPVQPADVVLAGPVDRPIIRFTESGPDSGWLSDRLQGELRSQTLTIEKPHVHILAGGRSARLNLIIDGYTLIMNPMYGGLTIVATNEQPAWKTMAVDRWIGHRAYIEISDSSIPVHRLNPPPSNARVPEDNPNGYILVKQLLFSSDQTPPPIQPNSLNRHALENVEAGNSQALAGAYQTLVLAELDRWKSGNKPGRTEEGAALLNWLLQNDLINRPAASLDGATNSSAYAKGRLFPDPIVRLIEQYREIAASLVSPRRAPALADGTGEDEFIFLRGNWALPRIC